MADGIVAPPVKPASATETLLHTGNADKQLLYQVVMCNIDASASACNVFLQASGETLPTAAKELIYQGSVGANSSTPTLALPLGAGDRIVVESDSGNVTFTCMGTEKPVSSASTFFAQDVPTATVATLMYTVPANKRVHFNVLSSNTNGSDCTFEMYVLQAGESTTDATTQQDIQVIPTGSTYATDSYTASAGQKVYVKCSVDDVAVNVIGIIESV